MMLFSREEFMMHLPIARLRRKLSLFTCLAACAWSAQATSESSFTLQEATIESIQSAILAKEITTTELVELYLKRIQAYNGTCVDQPYGILGPITTIPNAGQINALSTLNLRPENQKTWGFDERKARSLTDRVDDHASMPDALEIAAAMDKKFAETGQLMGPLHGVVMAIKDQYDTFDMRTTSGADAFYANDRPPTDAEFVARLRNAGAIILAKANLGEYASGIPRSSFGGTFCNPYDTERSPRGSSSGSGTAVAANLVTCAIAEETGSSIRGPASASNTVGIAATQELVSRHGMIQFGINTRTGPICRTVKDTAMILDVIAGYDAKDELTAFTKGRMPEASYASFAEPGRLDGVRIGVVREYMHKSLFTKAEEQTIDIVSAAVEDLKKLGATVIDPGQGDLFTDCIREYAPKNLGKLFTRRFPELFPVDEHGKPTEDHTSLLLDMKMDPSLVPEDLTLRAFGTSQSIGQSKIMLNYYLRLRGDEKIKSNADLIAHSNFHNDPTFPDRKASRESTERAVEYDMSDRMMLRFAVQQVLAQCMVKQDLHAIVYPTSALPPTKLGSPGGPPINGRSARGVWTFIGGHGIPTITVPAGFTTEVYDRIRDPEAPLTPESAWGPGGGGGNRLEGDDRTRLVGPVSAAVPVGVDFAGLPFSEPMLLRIAAAYEAATGHRKPPADFGPLAEEP